MTLKEVTTKYNISESSLQQNFKKTQKSIMKKYGVIINKSGRGASAVYTEEIIRSEADTRAITMYEETKENISMESEMFNTLVDWDFIVLLAILTTPLLVFRGNYTQFLEYVKIKSNPDNIQKLKDTLDDLSKKNIILYTLDTSTDDEYFIASIYKKVENEMQIGIEMIKKCKELADKNNMQYNGWSKLLKTWLGVQILYKRQPYTMKELSSVTGLSENTLRKCGKILEKDYIFYTDKAYAAYDVCLGKYVTLNGIYEDNRGKGPAEFKYDVESQPE